VVRDYVSVPYACRAASPTPSSSLLTDTDACEQTDTLQGLQRGIAERFCLAVPQHMQGLVFANSVLWVDRKGRGGEEEEDASLAKKRRAKTLDECGITHSSVMYVLTPKNLTSCRWKIVMFSSEESGDLAAKVDADAGRVEWRPGEKVGEMENVIERAQASAWKLGSLRQRLPVVRTLMSIGDDHTAMPGQTSKSRISNSKSKDVKLQLSGSTRDPGMTQAEVIEVRKNFLLLSASVAFSGLAVLLKGSCVCVCVRARARERTYMCVL
jgi:hypothetical protein